VLPLAAHDAEALAPLLPRFFLDAFGAVALRVAAGKVVYLGFEDRLDPVLALALERISGLRVESGIVPTSQFAPAQARMLEAAFPSAELLEATSEPSSSAPSRAASSRFAPSMHAWSGFTIASGSACGARRRPAPFPRLRRSLTSSAPSALSNRAPSQASPPALPKKLPGRHRPIGASRSTPLDRSGTDF
jgi:hypothetical protein